jgi:hypothetical protein
MDLQRSTSILQDSQLNGPSQARRTPAHLRLQVSPAKSPSLHGRDTNPKD